MGKEKHRWFRKRKETVQEQEQVNSGEEIKTFKRRSRIKEEEKVATVEEVKEVVRPSIFKERAESEKEFDYLEKKTSIEGALYQDDVLEDNAVEDTLIISKKIADAFELKNFKDEDEPKEDFSLFDLPEEPELEATVDTEESALDEVLEEEPARRPLNRSGLDVLERLKTDTEDYQSRCINCEDDFCNLTYVSDSVPDVVSESGKLKLASYRVYVDGIEKEWDNLFEVKVPAGSRVEIETGVGLAIPKDSVLEIAIARHTLEKYNLRMSPFNKSVLSSNEALEPVIVSFIANEGAYLSKVGRVVECQIIV